MDEIKTLLVLRHAKSGWDNPALTDFERPLARRGERDAPRVGEALRERGVIPELILSSPAVRTRQTIEAIVTSAQLEHATMRFVDDLYAASLATLRKAITGLPEDVGCALLVGHNPGLAELVSGLTGSREGMPTAALACIVCDTDRWEQVYEEGGTLAWLITPAALAP